MTGAFVLALLSAVYASFINFYIDRATTFDEKLRFARQVNGWVRSAFYAFFFGLLFHTIGLSRAGWVYFETATSRWTPLVIFLFTAALILVLFVVVIKVHVRCADESFQPEADRLVAATYASSQSNNRTLSTRYLDNVHRSDRKVHDFLLNQCGNITGRAVFIIGFSQSAVTR